METKTCPSCGADVPAVANRCRHCFHDFHVKAPARGRGAASFVAALAGMAVVSAATFWWMSQQPTDTQILVDGSSRTIQWVQQFQDGDLKTDRVAFDDVVRVEYRVSGMGDNEIAVVLADGGRKVVEARRNQNLQLKAEEYAKLIGKPLELKDETKAAFGDR